MGTVLSQLKNEDEIVDESAEQTNAKTEEDNTAVEEKRNIENEFITPKRKRSFEILIPMARPLEEASSSNMSTPSRPPKRKRVDHGHEQIRKIKRGSTEARSPSQRSIQARREPDGELLFRPGHVSRENDKRTGWFSPEEIQVLEQFKIKFCNRYQISTELFDKTVQSSYKRKDGIFQTNDYGITHQQFWKDAYELLPDRDRRSIYRFMRRHFQSGSKPHQWTTEDDDELERLHDKLGPKWATIARELERTQDDVVQRWKNKVEHRNTMREGPWEEDEIEKLISSLEHLYDLQIKSGQDKKTIGKDIYEMGDRYISWGAVSNHIGNTRSRQQCADKWRKIRRSIKQQRAMGDKNAVYEHGVKYRRIMKKNMEPAVPETPAKSAERVEERVEESSDEEEESRVNSTRASESGDSEDRSDDSDRSSDEGDENDNDNTNTNGSLGDPVAAPRRGEDEEEEVIAETQYSQASSRSSRSSSAASETNGHIENSGLGALPSQELGIDSKAPVRIKKEETKSYSSLDRGSDGGEYSEAGGDDDEEEEEDDDDVPRNPWLYKRSPSV